MELSKAQRKRDRETAQMSKSEPETDTAKATFQSGEVARKLRAKGCSLVGETVKFAVHHYRPETGKIIATGKTATGVVIRWDDLTQTLKVRVEGELMPFSVKLEYLIEGD